MCGIVGFIDRSSSVDALLSRGLINRMTDQLAHRGPDGHGLFFDDQCGMALGHRRLSIVDLSDAGKQPMHSADGRWIIIFNGEIYNYLEIRQKLNADVPGLQWRGNSDTEVLVEAISRYGFEQALKITNGMFAIAAWDGRDRNIFLARDRMGEKPLYYGWQGTAFLFSSELKALSVHPKFGNKIDPQVVSLYLAYGYVPHPHSIYAGMFQLSPGTYLKMSADAVAGTAPAQTPYWSIPVPSPRQMDEQTAIGELDTLLHDAVRLRMRADVPMGAFLSGGIDSSTIVSIMQAQSARSVRTFSIGFEEEAYDESKYAKEVANFLKTTHTEIRVTARDALDTIPTIPRLYDEPFADSSQIPTFLLSKLTRQHVTVSLSGDGGDELFGGYERYFDFERRWQARSHLIDGLRSSISSIASMSPAQIWQIARLFAPAAIKNKLLPHKIRQKAAEFGCRTEQELYTYLMQIWPPIMLRRPPVAAGMTFFDRLDITDFGDPYLGMLYLDSCSYLPDDILVKVDRATMAASLESRVPLLDHRVVEFASALPLGLKRRAGVGKWILKRVLDRYMPSSMFDRPKRGFGVPLHQWLRGPLKEWGDDLLRDTDTIIGQLIDLSAVREVWKEHLETDADHSPRLWTILMLISWAREWRPC